MLYTSNILQFCQLKLYKAGETWWKAGKVADRTLEPGKCPRCPRCQEGKVVNFLSSGWRDR